MRRLKILLVIWILFGFVFARIDSQSLGDFADLIKEKERRFQEKFPGWKSKPRIIIAGGSNAFWGMDSRVLNRLTNTPVINLSLPSEGGDPVLMRAIALEHATRGDVIVYASLDFWIDVGIDKHRSSYIGRKLELKSYYVGPHDLSWRERLDFYWKIFPSELNPVKAIKQVFFQTIPTGDYFTKANSFGDFEGCVPQPVTPFMKDSEGNYKKFAQDIREYKELASQKGVRVVNVAPWILIKPEEKADWVSYYKTVQAELGEKPYRFDYADIVLRTDPAEFCDTNAHLTRTLAEVRMKKHVGLKVLKALDESPRPSL